jgi:hypothetical protein
MLSKRPFTKRSHDWPIQNFSLLHLFAAITKSTCNTCLRLCFHFQPRQIYRPRSHYCNHLRMATFGGEAESVGSTSGDPRAEVAEDVPVAVALARVRAQAAEAEILLSLQARTSSHSTTHLLHPLLHLQVEQTQVHPHLSPSLSPSRSSADFSAFAPSSARSDTSVSAASGRVVRQAPERLNHFQRANRASDSASRRHRTARLARVLSPLRRQPSPLQQRLLLLLGRPTRSGYIDPSGHQAQSMAAVSSSCFFPQAR